MGHDVYSALSGAFGALNRLDVIANNLANVNSSGFKRERVAFEATGPGEAYARVAEGQYDMRDGDLTETGNPLDIALRGPGWLVTDGVDGQGPYLTRDGQLHLDPDSGVLRHPTGGAVMGQEGPIVVNPGQTVRIDEDGKVWGSEDGYVDTLRVVQSAAEPVGTNLWRPLTLMLDTAPTMVPGAVERSNVNPTVAMVELVEASRLFETLQNAMRSSDELDSRLNAFGGGR